MSFSQTATVMKELLSPNQVAKAIGVSESSLKRWADQGRITTVRTAGGHRRLPVSSVLEFVREQGLELIDASVLGLPPTTGSGARTLDRGRDHLVEALTNGSFDAALQVVIDLYLVPYHLAEIFDVVIQPALATVGHQWEQGELEIYEERRSIEFCSRMLHELSRMLPPPDTTGPKAIGGTLDGDPYTTATRMAELVLRSVSYRSIALGNELPFGTVKKAVTIEEPAMLWLSISSVRDPGDFTDRMLDLYEHCINSRTLFVVGGKALTGEVRRPLKYHGYCETMSDLASFGQGQFEQLRGEQYIGG